MLPRLSWPEAVALGSEMLLPMRMFWLPVVKLAMLVEEVAVARRRLLEPVVTL